MWMEAQLKAFHTVNDETMRLIATEAKSINGYRDRWRLAFKPDEMEAVLESSIFKSISCLLKAQWNK